MKGIMLPALGLVAAWMLVGSVPALAVTADLAPGTLIRTESSKAVYYLDTDLKRHVFPNSQIFKSWYDDFGKVVVLTDEEISQYPLGGTVPYKPAKRLVKIQTDPKVYAVDDGGVLRWVKTEQVARSIYGDDWNKMIDDLSDAFFANYELGEDIDETEDFDVQVKIKIKKVGDSLKTWRIRENHERAVREGEPEDDSNDGYGHDKVAVCHNFGLNHPHTIYISSAALPAHLAKGATEGKCLNEDDEDVNDDADEDVNDDSDEDVNDDSDEDVNDDADGDVNDDGNDDVNDDSNDDSNDDVNDDSGDDNNDDSNDDSL